MTTATARKTSLKAVQLYTQVVIKTVNTVISRCYFAEDGTLARARVWLLYDVLVSLLFYLFHVIRERDKFL